MKRPAGPQLSMFLRINRRAALVRKSGTLTALFAIVIAAAVVTAMLNLYADVGAKLQREFRSYGANLVITASNGQPLPEDVLRVADRVLAGHGIAVPFAYAVARTDTGSPIVVAGTDLQSVRRMNTWWSVSQWPTSPGSALVGTRAASALSPQGGEFALTFSGKRLPLKIAGTLHTGADEDSRVYLDLTEFRTWTGVAPATIEIAASGSPAEIEDARQHLSAALPGLEVKPVRQILEGEARVLNKTRASLFASAVLIITTAGLCVLATLMAWVMEQRKNVAVMRALGASERLVNALFAAQAGLLGAAGAVPGFGLGIAAAAWIGQTNFHAMVTPRFSVFPTVLAGSIAVALLAAVLPVSLLRKAQPAAVLRGE